VKKLIHPSDKRDVTLTIDPPRALGDPTATAEAWRNLENNLRALRGTQPGLLADVALPAESELVFARDGMLSARSANHWWSSCSVPRLAAREMLRKLELHGAVGCFLAPSHSAQVRAALDRIRPEQALIIAVPLTDDLKLILHCEDFASDIAAHRLWFAAGEEWDRELGAILDSRPGLAAPSQFIRMPSADAEMLAGMISSAQRVFSTVASRRTDELRALPAAPSSNALTGLCIVAPSRFRLWNDVGGALLSAMRRDAGWRHFDPDDPCSSSTLALAHSSRQCGALLTANTSRADLKGVVPESVRWITWLTTPRIPHFRAVGPRDALLLADEHWIDAAVRAGWPRERLHPARWPYILEGLARRPAAPCGIIADTRSLERPEDLNDYSSHGLLWDFIRQEILASPFVLGEDLAEYLSSRMHDFAIADDAFPRARFIDQLMIPAWQQSIARILIGAKVPLKLAGEGWESIAEFRAHAAGPIHSRDALSAALSECAAVLHVWPVNCVHPIDFCGIPVIPRPADAKSLLLAARRAIVGTTAPGKASIPPLSHQLISRILDCG
jgi:hypothetical protein